MIRQREELHVPEKKASGPLTVEQLGCIAEKSLANAVTLLNEARVFFERGSPPRALALAILAGEEFGKCQLALGAIGLVNPDAEYWKDFWTAFYSHGEKLIRAAFIAVWGLDERLVEQFVKVLRSALSQKRREASFYVDVHLGEVVSPDEEIGEDEVLAALETFEFLIHGYAKIYDGRSLADEFVAETSKAQKMRIALDSRNVEDVKSVWLETRGLELTTSQLDWIVAGWVNEDGER